MTDNSQPIPEIQEGQSVPNEANSSTTVVSEKTKFETELKKKDNEIGCLKKRVAQLEEDLSEVQRFKAQHQKQAEEIEVLKNASEDTLTRAKSMIFERTKVIKNQELQIDALNQQIASMKDVVAITKDLLEIRNLEVKQLETKIKCLEDKFAAEKERYELMHKKLEHMIRYNGDLKREYETQLCLFSALRERYNERELARDVIDDLRTEIADETANNQVNGEAEQNPARDVVIDDVPTAIADETANNQANQVNGKAEQNPQPEANADNK